MSEPKFVNKRKFAMPRSTFVLFALPRDEWKKLEAWVSKADKITIAPCSNGEVFLLNERRLAKYEAAKKLKRES